MIDAEAVAKVNASLRNPGAAEASLAYLAQVCERFPQARIYEMQAATVLNEAERLRKAKDLPGAIAWLESAIENYGANTKMEAALKTMRHNRVVELHNAFAKLFNAKNFQRAMTVIQDALQEFPTESQLLNDFGLVERVLN